MERKEVRRKRRNRRSLKTAWSRGSGKKEGTKERERAVFMPLTMVRGV